MDVSRWGMLLGVSFQYFWASGTVYKAGAVDLYTYIPVSLVVYAHLLTAFLLVLAGLSSAIEWFGFDLCSELQMPIDHKDVYPGNPVLKKSNHPSACNPRKRDDCSGTTGSHQLKAIS